MLRRKTLTPEKSKKRKTENSGRTKTLANIPSKSIKHILSLGFEKSDAPRLYDQKEDWMGINTGGALFCSQRGCNFVTKLGSEKLFDHCIEEHGWKVRGLEFV